jgi:hypothetical protein
LFNKKICPRCFKKIGLFEKVLYKDEIKALTNNAGDVTPYSWREVWHKKCATPEELIQLKQQKKKKKRYSR